MNCQSEASGQAQWRISKISGFWLTVILLLASTVVTTPATAQEDDNWEFYGRWGVGNLATDRENANNIYVWAMERIGDTVYVGGAFQEVIFRGHRSRPIDQPFLAAFDARNGDFIGSFRPELDHPVYALDTHPTTGDLLVGGEFTQVNGAARQAIVALDPITGATVTSFATTVNQGGAPRAVVRGIDSDNSNIYLGGRFNTSYDGISSQLRHNLVKVDLSGHIDSSWNPAVSGGGVWDIALTTDEQRLIVGGRFSHLDDQPRPGVAMVAATGDGALTDTFTIWQRVGTICSAGYPFCLFIYDIEVDNGEVLITGAEHFSSLHDDTTGQRKNVWNDGHDTQAGLFVGDNMWITRHGRSRGQGLWYRRDRTTGALNVSTDSLGPSRGAGGFAFELGDNDCIWMGGTLAGFDIAEDATTNRVGVDHMGFLCPPGTVVPAGTRTIDNWDTEPPPDPAEVTCEASLTAGQVSVTWDTIGGANATIVYRTPAGGNRAYWQGRVEQPGLSFDQSIGGADSYAYIIRLRSGSSLSDPIDCGTVTNVVEPPPDVQCEVALNGNDVNVTWDTNGGAQAAVVFRSPDGGTTNHWRGRVDAPAVAFIDAASRTGTFDYTIKFRSNNRLSDATDCGSVTVP